MTKLIAFGDSIFAGWDGTRNVGDNQRIPELVGKELGWEIENWAISGTKYDQLLYWLPWDSRSAPNHRLRLCDLDVWCKQFGWPDSFDTIKQCLQAGIDKAKVTKSNC